MLKFNGIGSAFNTKLGNTSAFIKKSKSLLLIDCGGTVFDRLLKLNLLQKFENIYIIITHTHPDHVGSLGEVIFYSYYILNKKPNIYFPQKELMENFLGYIGVSNKMYNLEDNNIAEIYDSFLGKVKLEFISVTHVDTIPSYGFFITLNDEKVYYSGDSNNISSRVIDELKQGKIIKLYQDTCGLDYEGNNHLSLKRLCTMIPSQLRYKIYCMHLDTHITEKQIIDSGFNLVNVYKNM